MAVGDGPLRLDKIPGDGGIADGGGVADDGVVRVDNLVFDYPGQRALHDVSCHIARASITALVGPNGAGKTTLMRCIAGLETPFSGTVTVAGLDVVEDPRRAHRKIGYLQDFFGLYDDLTVRHCLDFHAAANGTAAASRPQAVKRTAARLGLADRLDQRAGTLSRGLRQRLAIAQAIIHEPNVILLDEPSAGLDPEARDDLSSLLRDLRATGLTLIVSSHILTELQDYSTHMMILRNGRVVEHCPIDGAAQAAERRLRLVLCRPVDNLALRLAAMPGVGDASVEVSADGADAGFRFAGDLAAQHDLLRQLLEAGLPVAGLAEEKRTLERAYRDHLSRDRRGAPEGPRS